MTEITSNTPAVRKFMFDRSFSVTGEDIDPVTGKKISKPIYTQEQLDEATQSARKSGHNEGLKATQADMHAHHNELLKKLMTRLSETMEDKAAKQAAQQLETIEVAIAITRKLLPDYIAKHGSDEIRAIIEQIVHEMSHEPRLVVRIHDSLFEEINKIVSSIAEGSAYTGKVVVMADQSVDTSDCRIEWADGGIERSERNIWGEIDNIMAHLKKSSTQSQGNTEANQPEKTSTTPSTDVAV